MIVSFRRQNTVDHDTVSRKWVTTLVVSALVWLIACSPPPGDPCGSATDDRLERPRVDLVAPEVSRLNLRSWIETLASPKLAGRHAGDPEARAVAAALAEQMSSLGLDASPSWGAICRSFPYLDGEEVNVVGHLASGSATQHWILIGAHYDGQGVHPAGMIYPGADDNASGVAALLEIARLAALTSQGSTTGQTTQIGWIFAAIGGEEVGQIGSRAYLARPSVDLSQVDLMINLDMVGRILPSANGPAIGYRVLSEPRQEIAEQLLRAAATSDIEMHRLEDLGPGTPMLTDGEIFAAKVPTLLLSTGLHADHHELTDTPDRIDYGQIERTVNLVLVMADILASRP